MKHALRWCALALVLAAPPAASAHTDRWAFSDFTFEDRQVLFTLRTTLRDVAECVRVDKNGDGDVTEDELKGAGADLLAYVNSKVTLTVNGRPVQAKLAGMDPPRGFDPPWPILSIDKIWFVVDFTYESPEPISEVTIAARLFDAIPHHLNKGKMVRGDEERAWLFNDVYRATFGDAAAKAAEEQREKGEEEKRREGEKETRGQGNKGSRAEAQATPAEPLAIAPPPPPDVAPRAAVPPRAGTGAEEQRSGGERGNGRQGDEETERQGGKGLKGGLERRPGSGASERGLPSALAASSSSPAVSLPPVPSVPSPPGSLDSPSSALPFPSAPPLPGSSALSPLGPSVPPFVAGLRHALRPDHLLFVIALALAAGSAGAQARAAAAYAGATVLGLAAAWAGGARLPGTLGEEVLALMLVFAGVENLALNGRRRTNGAPAPWRGPTGGNADGRWMLTALGALHGAGMAEPGAGPAVAIGAAGWGAATLAAAAGVYVVVAALRRTPRLYTLVFLRGGSVAIIVAGAARLADRL